MRSLEHVEADDVVSELAKAAPQALAKMSGASRQENPHGAEDKGTAACLRERASGSPWGVQDRAVSTGAGVSTIPEVIARMEAIEAALPRKDGVAIFDRLDVIFAGLYFDADATIGSGGSCPVAWRPLVETRSHRREPIQFALAGMAGRINHDLPIAVFTTADEFGLPVEDDTAMHRDFQRVDGLLAAVETHVARWFDTGLIADLEDVTPQKTDEAIAMWSLAGARDVAWDHAKILWGLRHAGPIRDTYLDGLARTTELTARAMLV